MAENQQTNLDTTLGRIVVDLGLATNDELEAVLKLQQQALSDSDAGQSSLADLLIAEGIVTENQIQRLRPMVEDQRKQQIPGYHVLKKIGSGAMATVYKAKQISLDRIVAIKVLSKKQTRNPKFVERFYAEGRAAAKLNHPNIVGALDVGKAGDFHYFVMEYVEGKTVFDDIAERGHYEEQKGLEIAVQVARALEHSHSAGFIHRDVKPKNIIITNNGIVKLADMGLAREVTDQATADAEQGKAYGTPYYISPEQIRGEIDIDFRADIYGLGATLYHMVTGRVPFEGPNPSAVMHKHLKESLIPPDHLNSDLSAGICEIIEVCMAKNRNQRYNDTADLVHDLEAVTRGEPPLHARQKFDVSSLTQLEKTGQLTEADPDQPYVNISGPVPLTEQPVFWFAIAGWGLAVLAILAILILIVANR